MDARETAAKGSAISKAIDIIANGLKVSLDRDAGGDLADRLAALYDYMCDRLLFANLRDNRAALDEVGRLLNELADAWKQIGNSESARTA
jgi:flagellar protein FliS